MSRLAAARAALVGVRGLAWSEDLPVLGLGLRFGGRDGQRSLVWHVSPESELAAPLQSGARPWVPHVVHVGSEARGRSVNVVCGPLLPCYLVAARRRFRGCTEVQARLVVMCGGRPQLVAFGSKGEKVEPTWTAARSLARVCSRAGIPTGVVQVWLRAGAPGALPACEAARERAAPLLEGKLEPTEAELEGALVDPAGPLWPELIRLTTEAAPWARSDAWAAEGEGAQHGQQGREE